MIHGMTAPFRAARAGAAALLSMLLVTCSPPVSLLTQIKTRGYISIVTLNSATTYYLGPNGPTGLDYDLARRFAEALGVKLRLIVTDSLEDVLPTLHRRHADVAAGLEVTPKRQEKIRFAPAIRSVTPQLVYRRGDPKPAALGDLKGKLMVVKGSPHAEHLRRLAQVYPKLDWAATDTDGEELLYRVAQGKLGYTIATSDIIAIDRRYYPALQVAFDVGPPQAVAWAFPSRSDDSVYNRAIEFFIHLRRDGELKRLLDRYFGYVDRLDYVGRKTFERDADKRLPRFRDIFKKAAKHYDLDWRLLAAMSYQESHWKPHAKSPTGVRGLMMLTLDTADYLGVDNRLDPQQSISGGARYLRDLLDRLPDSIPKPDRLWMALATYNLGLGHLLDARDITRERGGDPDRWVDVRENLPLLTREKWYSHTHYGYARGHEAVTYVGNIRNYYDILVWMTTRHKTPPPKEAPEQPDLRTASNEAAPAEDAEPAAAATPPATPKAKAKAKAAGKALNIDNPAL